MNSSRSFKKGFISLFSGNVVAQVIPFVFAPFLSRIFTKEEFAIQANFMAIVGIISIISSGRYELAVVLPKLEKKAQNLVSLSIMLILIVSVLSLSTILLEEEIAALYETKELGKYLPFISLGVLVSALVSVFVNLSVRNKKYGVISISKIIQSICINAVTLFLGYYNYGTDGLIFGWLFGLILGVVVLLVGIRKQVNIDEVNLEEIKLVAKEYKDFPMVNSVHAFSDLFFSQFILYTLITKEFGLVSLGLFFMMNKYLKAPIRVIGSAVGQVYYKEANDKKNNGDDVFKTLKESVKLVSYFAIPICLIIIVLGPQIFGWYLGDEWMESGVYAQIMAVPILFNFLVSPISSTTLIYGKQKKALIISLIGYSLSVVAFEIGVYFEFDFANSLKLFAFAMSLYYIYLLFWYSSLTKSK